MSGKYRIGSGILCFTALLVLSAAQETKVSETVRNLLSDDFSKIKAAKEQLITDRNETIAALLSIVRDRRNLERKPASVEAAMEVLGEMRAVEAMGDLVRRIGYPMVPIDPMNPLPVVAGGMHVIGDGRLEEIRDLCPAVRALVRIGEVCLPDVVTKITEADSVFEQRACLAVLVGLKDREPVATMLKDAQAKETDDKKRARLQSARDRLKQAPL